MGSSASEPGRSERVALAPVAVGAQQLEVLNGRRAATGDGKDVVVLQVEPPLALHTPPAVALEHGPAQLGGNGHARRAPSLFCTHYAVRGTDLLLQLSLALKQQRPDVFARELVRVPEEAVVKVPQPAASLAQQLDRHRRLLGANCFDLPRLPANVGDPATQLDAVAAGEQ